MSFIDYRMLEIGNAARKFSENLTEEEEEEEEEEEKRFSGGRASPIYLMGGREGSVSGLISL
jgi:hypothetical protein